MEVIKIVCNDKTFKIKREVIVYVLFRLSGKDYSSKDDKTILKAMESYYLINEMTLESMQN